jgi:hypothetical protein
MQFEHLRLFFNIVFGFSGAPAAIVVLRAVIYFINLWNFCGSKEQSMKCSVVPVLEWHH